MVFNHAGRCPQDHQIRGRMKKRIPDKPVLLPDRSGWTFPDKRTIRIFNRGSHPTAQTALLAWIETPSTGLAEWRGLRFQPDDWNEWALYESREPNKHLEALGMTATGLSIVHGKPCLRTGETLGGAAAGTVPDWMPTPHPEEVLLAAKNQGRRPTAAQRKAATGPQLTDCQTAAQRGRRNDALENRFAVLTALLAAWRRMAPTAPTILEVVREVTLDAPNPRPNLTRKRIGQILADLGFDWLPADESWASYRIGLR